MRSPPTLLPPPPKKKTTTLERALDFKPPSNMADNALVDQIAGRVMEKLRGASIQDGGNSRTPERSEMNFVNPNNNSESNRRGPPRG